MKKALIAKIQISIIALAILSVTAVNAQTTKRVFTLKTGDKYLKQTSVVSSSILQRGDVRVTIGSSSTVAKSYQVTKVDTAEFAFNIATRKVMDTVELGDKQLAFSSAKKLDTAEKMANILQNLLGKPTEISVDKNGIIASLKTAPRTTDDTVLDFAGIHPEEYTPGTKFGLLTSIKVDGALKRNYSWTDTAELTGGGNVITKFSVAGHTSSSTIIKFASIGKQRSENSNSTGEYVIDNETGIIKQRVIQTVSTGYTVYKNKVFAATRRTALSESCYKVNALKDAYLQVPPIIKVVVK